MLWATRAATNTTLAEGVDSVRPVLAMRAVPLTTAALYLYALRQTRQIAPGLQRAVVGVL